MNYLLDTHAVLWASEGDARLGVGAKAVLERCSSGEAAISAITLLEVAMLVHKERIRLAVPIKRYLLEMEAQYRVLSMEAAIAAEAFSLPLRQGDPFDRVIVATGRYHALPLITRDQSITRSGLVEVIW